MLLSLVHFCSLFIIRIKHSQANIYTLVNLNILSYNPCQAHICSCEEDVVFFCVESVLSAKPGLHNNSLET